MPAGLNLSTVTRCTSGGLSRTSTTTGPSRSAPRCSACTRCCSSGACSSTRGGADPRAHVGGLPAAASDHGVPGAQTAAPGRPRPRRPAAARAPFCCFLDLKGADEVPRPLLWEALRRLGVHGDMLAAVQALYAGAGYAVHIGGRRRDSLLSGCGVKQGCPLSPTLFGLLLDGLQSALQSRARSRMRCATEEARLALRAQHGSGLMAVETQGTSVPSNVAYMVMVGSFGYQNLLERLSRMHSVPACCTRAALYHPVPRGPPEQQCQCANERQHVCMWSKMTNRVH